MIPLRPPEPGKRKAMALTVLVHVALLVVLFFGVQWKRSAPDVVEVELWSARPAAPTAAPPPPEPKPEPPPEPRPEPRPQPKPEPVVKPPVKPDIALKEEKRKPEPKKPEPEPKKPEAKPEPKKPDFSDLLKRENSERLPRPDTRQMANAAAAEMDQRTAAGRRGLADYAARIRGKVRGNIVLPPNIADNPEAVFRVTQLPTGEVMAVHLEKSSGNASLDAAIERALRKSSPLPKPDNPADFQRELDIKYRPFEE